MGLFAVFLACAIVVLQSTLILSNRKPNQWGFSLLQKKSLVIDWGNISGTHHVLDQPFETAIQPLLPSAFFSGLACLRYSWESGKWPPRQCESGYHLPQEITSIPGGSWNPHLILLAIACAHLVITLSTAQAQHMVRENANKTNFFLNMDNANYSSRIYQFSLSICLTFLFMFWLIVALIAANRQTVGVFDTPTVFVGLVLLLACARFLYVHHQYFFSTPTTTTSSSSSSLLMCGNECAEEISSSYFLWNQTFQQQIISVPLCVLMLSVMGVRLYSDVLTHLILLSTSVNSMWLQDRLFPFSNHDSHGIFLLFLKLLTVGIPLYSLFMAQEQWGEAGTWQRVTVYMAFFSLAPLLIFSMMFSGGAAQSSFSYERDRMRIRLCTMTTMVALGSSVVNLALL